MVPSLTMSKALAEKRRELNSKKGEITMRYVKPSLTTLGVASVAIQHMVGNKSQPNALDASIDQRPLQSTGTAYDLDE